MKLTTLALACCGFALSQVRSHLRTQIKSSQGQASGPTTVRFGMSNAPDV